MNDSVTVWLAEVEACLRRMVRGVFQFAFGRLPEWIYRTLIEVIGPAAVRLVRVLVVLSIWLAVVIGPVVLAVRFELSSRLCVLAFGWAVLALIGSAWGRANLARERRSENELNSVPTRFNVVGGSSRQASV